MRVRFLQNRLCLRNISGVERIEPLARDTAERADSCLLQILVVRGALHDTEQQFLREIEERHQPAPWLGGEKRAASRAISRRRYAVSNTRHCSIRRPSRSSPLSFITVNGTATSSITGTSTCT